MGFRLPALSDCQNGLSFEGSWREPFQHTILLPHLTSFSYLTSLNVLRVKLIKVKREGREVGDKEVERQRMEVEGAVFPFHSRSPFILHAVGRTMGREGNVAPVNHLRPLAVNQSQLWILLPLDAHLERQRAVNPKS
jgi:hypothetical protein